MRCWQHHSSYESVVQQSIWTSQNKLSSFTSTMTHLHHTLRNWNKHEFGNIFKNISNILSAIDVQNALPPTVETKSALTGLHNDLESWYAIEKTYWSQHVKDKWIKENDHNTQFFSSACF